MRLKVAKWGNSVAVRLPAELVERFRLSVGSTLDVDVDDTGFRVRLPARRIPGVPTLEEMVAEMRRLGPANEPETVDWGPDVGDELIEDQYSLGEAGSKEPHERADAARGR